GANGPVCSGRSPRRHAPASRASGRARSGHSRRPARARAPSGTPPPPRASAAGGSRRSRAPRGSRPSRARPSWPSPGRPWPAPSGPARGVFDPPGSSRTLRSSAQVGEVLLDQVLRVRQIPGRADLDPVHSLSRVDQALKRLGELVRRPAESVEHGAIEPLPEPPERRTAEPVGGIVVEYSRHATVLDPQPVP